MPRVTIGETAAGTTPPEEPGPVAPPSTANPPSTSADPAAGSSAVPPRPTGPVPASAGPAPVPAVPAQAGPVHDVTGQTATGQPGPVHSGPTAAEPIATPRPAPGAGTLYGRGQAAVPYAPPGYPYPPWVLVPIPPPRPRRRALPWVLGTITTVTVLAVLALGGFVAVNQYAVEGGLRGTWRAAPSPTELPPAANAPASEWASWARRTINDTVQAQAAALVAGDEEAFLAPVDSTNGQLVQEHQRRFRVLRAMGPGVWTQSVSGIPRASGERAWTADVRISYCFGAASCQAVQLVVGSEWALRDDRLLMIGLTPSDSSETGPRPWETDDLSVKTGERVVVAAQKANAWRLDDAVRAGDRAAAVADRLSKWSDPPSRYVVFLAGPDDWNRWYGHEQPEWAAAWAVPVSTSVTEVVIRTEVVQQRGLESLLTHELTHVTTLAGDRDGAGRSAWWLVEGIADYATMVDKSVRGYDALVPTRNFVRRDWDGNPAVDPPSTTASLEEASARYGIAFLAVRRIADLYTEEKLLAFFGRVVHDNDSLDTAALGALGVEWATVQDECAKFIRASVG